MMAYAGSVVAIVVSYNRPVELKKVITALKNQMRPPDHVIVVDNASLVPASVTLADYTNVEILRSDVNTGGAGGFAVGLSRSLELSPDWVWMMDDDAVPRTDALVKLLNSISVIAAYPGPIGALCPTVIEFDAVALVHRRKFYRWCGWESYIRPASYSSGPVEIDAGSFVGFLVNSKAALEVGVPKAGFFLSYDDTEYSLRLKKAGYRNWLVPNSLIDHLTTPASLLRSSNFGPKHYYNIRNRLVVLRMYCQPKVIATLLAAIKGILMWLLYGGLKSPSSIKLLIKALKDGMRENMGPLDCK